MTTTPSLFRPFGSGLALVHGLGRFGGGREAVRYLVRHGWRVRIADKSAGDDLQAVRQDLALGAAVDWQLGREDEALLDDVALFVVNQAVPDQHPLLAAAIARGMPRTQEVDLFLAAYPGKVVAVHAARGARVARGAALLVMEAMKMEHTIVAPADGTVDEVLFGVGEQVAEGAALVQFTPAA